MTKIVSMLLLYIQIQQKIIVYLIGSLIGKHIVRNSYDKPVKKPFVDNYDYDLSSSFCGDETYIRVNGKWQYIFFFFDAIKKIILSYPIFPNRDTLAAVKALDDVLCKLKSIPDDLTFVA